MKNLPTQTGDGGGKPNDSERGSAWSEWSEWSEEVQGFIPCCREDASNAWRRALSQVVKEMRAMRKSITPLYVGNLRRCKAPSHVVEGWEQCDERAPSHVMEGMRVMRGCAELSKRATANFAYTPQPFSFALRLLRLLSLVELDEQLLKVLHHRVPCRSNSRNKGRRIHRRSRVLRFT